METRGATILEGAGQVGGLVLDEDAGALAGLAGGAHQVGQVAQLEHGRVAHAGLGLDGDDVVEAVAVVAHHALVVEGDRRQLELAVVHAQGAAHDLAAARHDGVELGGHQAPPLCEALSAAR